ncbi:methionyl-tRNA formyltransferase [Corynebacterium poyangense]|uniref:Methionyl-tRNA formyltransferase n=1 Tax=Corynebacterium poyangense TaxID=2684405 RepID=A0A7H0SP14_9CORY|nr:methionyl-tRNA formyltransferase [Corynebacterium poyangense]QNQ90289.1 methionyl-tRNA formyltransferase [Corynebacterium poyangense]
MRLVFAGTPEPAVVALERLMASEHEVVGVITRPDAPRGRGRKLYPSPVKEFASQHGLEILIPSSLKPDTEDGKSLRHSLHSLAPDCIPVVAYGQLITPDLFTICPHGWVNLHFSLLPAWRGAAPVQAAIAAGDEITGASTFRIEEGLDTGPVFGTVTERISPTDTADDLLTRLAHSGAELLVATMDGISSGELSPSPQRGDISYAAKLTVADAAIDWHHPAFGVDRKIRAFTPGPGAWTMCEQQRIKISPVSIPWSSDYTLDAAGVPPLDPGQVWWNKKHVFVGTGTQPVQLGMVQPQGKKKMPARDWVRGLHESKELKFS